MKQKPKLGQNFLVDHAACAAIADALGDVSHSTVLEIGPGHGAITSLLVPRCRQLIALELDSALVKELQFRFREQPHFHIVEGDVLAADFAALIPENEKAALVGNLPYYITSDILLKLFAAHAVLDRAVVMIQREVAERVAAAPGGREYGLLSATAQMYARVENIFTLPPEAFSPPPEVYSTVLRLTFSPRFEELGVDAPGFDRFLKQCFSQKRKTLANNLRAAGREPAQITQALAASGIPPQMRAESVTLEAMAALYNALQAMQ
ncbi:MAG: 16S rRNA (adenine(1518)-N(6)/adenine(1519)-N(6))-dimethyltransferase RsmA [Acidobacteriaceae bacterium]